MLIEYNNTFEIYVKYLDENPRFFHKMPIFIDFSPNISYTAPVLLFFN